MQLSQFVFGQHSFEKKIVAVAALVMIAFALKTICRMMNEYHLALEPQRYTFS